MAGLWGYVTGARWGDQVDLLSPLGIQALEARFEVGSFFISPIRLL